MTLEELITQLNNNPEAVEFNQVMELITGIYNYTPTRFTNGVEGDLVINEAGTNEGSCRIFAFAYDQQLTLQQTLHCFGNYYRDDVLKDPEGTGHGNIRAFMKYGWDGIHFDSFPLSAK